MVTRVRAFRLLFWAGRWCRRLFWVRAWLEKQALKKCFYVRGISVGFYYVLVCWWCLSAGFLYWNQVFRGNVTRSTKILHNQPMKMCENRILHLAWRGPRMHAALIDTVPIVRKVSVQVTSSMIIHVMWHHKKCTGTIVAYACRLC